MELVKTALVIFIFVILSEAQQQQRRALPLSRDRVRTTTTPVPILKQINRVNEDGSYTYGYENADGSYKIETKDVNGQVKGKYGFLDDVGQLREIEYGASKTGFFPTGTDIQPPLLPEVRDNDPEDGTYDRQLHEAPYAYVHQEPRYQQPSRQPVRQQAPRQQIRQQAPRQQIRQQAPHQQIRQQAPRQQTIPAQQPQPQRSVQQQPNLSGLFRGHPASNVNLNLGSYSISY